MEISNEKIIEILREKKGLNDIKKELRITKADVKELKKILGGLENRGMIKKIKEGGKICYQSFGYNRKEKAQVRSGQSFLEGNKNKYGVTVILLLILLTGFYLRAYHLDYPVIGYHNWKEEVVLDESRNFYKDGFFRYGIFIAAVNYVPLGADLSGAHTYSFPMMSIIGAGFMHLFGPELWVGRIAGVLVGMASILMMYLLVKELFKRNDMALAAAFIMAITPIFIFFRLHTDVPSIFFVLVSVYFYARWAASDKGNHLILAAFFLAIAGAIRYPYLVLAIPIAVAFPYDRVINMEKLKAHIKEYVLSALMFLVIPIWHIYITQYVPKIYADELTGQFDQSPGLLLTSQWWTTLLFAPNSYISDNYSHIAFYLAVVGLILVGRAYLKNRDFATMFVLGYATAVIPFAVIMAPKLMGHNYHQFPIAPLVVILLAYLAAFIGDAANGFKIDNGKLKMENRPAGYVNWLAMASILILLWFPMQESSARMFDTQFPGLDVAGEYIKTHSGKDEFIMHSGHQDFGLAWHADRKLHETGLTSNVTEIKGAERDRNARWIFIYQWGMLIMQDKGQWGYIKENYKLRQFAFYMTKEGIQPVYFLFEKGGTYNEDELNRRLRDRGGYLHKDYEYTGGIARMYYIEINN